MYAKIDRAAVFFLAVVMFLATIPVALSRECLNHRFSLFVHRTLEDPVAFFTGGLCLFTTILAIATIRLFQITKDGMYEQAQFTKEALAHAKASAEAATLQARASLSAELPRPVIDAIEMRRSGVGNLRATLQAHNVVISMRNYGRTPAFLSRQCVDLIVCAVLPPSPPYTNVINFNTDTIIRQGESIELDRARLIDGNLLMSDEEIEFIITGRRFLYAFGFVQYRDFLNSMRIYKFCKCLSTPTDFSNSRWYDGPFAIPAEYM